MKLQIQKLTGKEETPWDLLLAADPEKEKIIEYLENGETYLALDNGKVVGAYVVSQISPHIIEIKNIAVVESNQGKGIGKELVFDAIKRAKEQHATRIEVGTGNSSIDQLAFYQKCGFRITGVVKDFFTKNYKNPIVENGIQCRDMIRLAIDF